MVFEYYLIPIFLGFLVLVLSLFFYKFSKNDNVSDVISLMRSIVTYNSHQLVKYSSIANEIMSDFKRANDLVVDGNKGIVDARERLSDFLVSNFVRVAQYNADYLGEYFSSRGGVSPKITFRVLSEEDVFKNFEGDLSVGSEENGEHGSAYSYVLKNRKFFLCNDVDGVSDKFWSFFRKESSFRSSLVVPLAVANNSLGFPFSEMIGLDGVEKFVFGFMIIDHPSKNYFTERDVAIAHMVSESLAGFLVVMRINSEFVGEIDEE